MISFPGGTEIKHLLANAGDARDVGSISGSGRSPGGGHGNAHQYSCLENPMDRGAWWAIVHRVAKNLPDNAGDARDVGSVPGSGRSPRGGNGDPLQYSCL